MIRNVGLRVFNRVDAHCRLSLRGKGWAACKGTTEMAFTVDWTGKSGTTYKYWSLTNITAAGIQAMEGNYVFARRLPNGNLVPLYFGEAGDLQARIPNHERWLQAFHLGATHVMAHSTPAGERARRAEERDLVQYWNPPLNVQQREIG